MRTRSLRVCALMHNNAAGVHLPTLIYNLTTDS